METALGAGIDATAGMPGVEVTSGGGARGSGMVDVCDMSSPEMTIGEFAEGLAGVAEAFSTD